MAKKFEIRNSTAEFLIFQLEGKEDGVQVVYKDETIWATQKVIAELFDVKVATVNEHLANIFKSGELQEEATIRKFRIVAPHSNFPEISDSCLAGVDAVAHRDNRI